MSLMVACEDAVFVSQEKLLNTLSSQVFRIGTRVGDGARTKLVNNLLAGINLVGAAEVMALSEHLGLSLDTTLSVIEQSSSMLPILVGPQSADASALLDVAAIAARARHLVSRAIIME
jgi:3-hydroxyisobutyrate dehydrogenase-like beta-hydroxyacid dehydrogenase